MLTEVQARSRQGDLLSLLLEDDSSGFRVAKIEGLDPVKATLISSSFAGSDGEQYQSSRREIRNIKIKIELVPDPETSTVRDLRKRLYRFFMPEAEVKLSLILEDGLEVDIVGRVESCETDHFSQDPTVDVSIICFEPDFYDPVPIVESGTTTSNETGMIITYDGSIETGIVLVLNVDRGLPDFTVYHVPPNDSIRTLEFDNAPLEAGDVLTISTVTGSKGATLVRAGTTSSVLYGVSPQSNWIELMPGDNSIRVYSEGAPIPLSIEYINKYGGL